MMTEQEAKERALILISERKFVEAGFVLLMLRAAPDNATAEEINTAQSTFFLGAKYMFDILHTPLVGGDSAISDLLDNLLVELKKFNEALPDGAVH